MSEIGDIYGTIFSGAICQLMPAILSSWEIDEEAFIGAAISRVASNCPQMACI